MPKTGSYRGLVKRVKQAGSGKLEKSRAYISHHFHDKTQKQERHLEKSGTVHSTDYKRIKGVLVK